MRNSKSLSELLARGGNKLSLLKARSLERSTVLTHVRAALPERLAQYVMSAGVDQGRLTVGVVGAVWASRLRYSTDLMRARVAKALGQEITAVRIRVVG
jgi:Dna[CI] antecedent, DciA